MSDIDPCKYYGHAWQRQPQESAKLPRAYNIEECSWCGEKRCVLNR